MTTAAGSTATRTARNVVAVALAEVAGKLGTFVLMLVAARVLGREDFGAFAYALSFGLLVATLPSWGFDTELITRGSREPAQVGRLLTTVLGLRLLVGLPVTVVAGGAGLLGRPGPEARLALVLVLVASVVDVFGDAGRAVAGALQDQRGVARALVVQRLLGCLLAVAAMGAGLGLVGLSAAYLLGTLSGAAGVAVAVRRLGVRLDRAGLAREQLRGFASGSVLVGVHSVAAMALFRLDAVLLGALVGDAEVGLYAAAYRLLETVLFVAFAVSRGVFPVLSAEATPAKVRYGLEQSLAVTALVYVPFAAVLLLRPEALLALLYGEAYAGEGATVLQLLAVAPLVYALSYLTGYALIAVDRTRRLVQVTLGATVLNLGLNLALVPREGARGAALATTATFAVQGLVLLVLLARAVGTPRVLRGLAVPALATVVVVGLLASPLPLLAALAASALLYPAAVLGLLPRLAPDQLSVLRSLVRRSS